MNNAAVEDMSFNEPRIEHRLNPTTKHRNSSRPRYCVLHSLHLHTLDSRTQDSQSKAHSETWTAKTAQL